MISQFWTVVEEGLVSPEPARDLFITLADKSLFCHLAHKDSQAELCNVCECVGDGVALLLEEGQKKLLYFSPYL